MSDWCMGEKFVGPRALNGGRCRNRTSHYSGYCVAHRWQWENLLDDASLKRPSWVSDIPPRRDADKPEHDWVELESLLRERGRRYLQELGNSERGES